MNRAPIIAEGLFSFEIGGSERVGADMALAFKARGYEVLCFALYGHAGPIKDELESQGIRCLDFDYTTRNRLTRRLTFQLEFWRFLRRENVQALHVHHATALLLTGVAAKLSPVRRLVMTEHALHQLRERPGYRRAAARYCRLADSITLVAEDQVDYFRDELGQRPERLFYLSNGVAVMSRDPSIRARLRAELGIGEDQFMFLFAGRLHETKDLPTLLRAVALWPDDMKRRACLVIAGGGIEEPALRELQESLGLQDLVRFIGPRRDVRHLMMAADAFVMSSRTEGLPMVLLEAMATGLPCLATAVGGIPRLFEGGAGVTVPSGRPDALSSQMQEVLLQEARRSQMSDRAMQKVRAEFDLDAVVTKYLSLLGLPARWDGAAELAQRNHVPA